ncbi:hypothetical protein [Priestia megaterium]|uniref:hypothetical protein n=1 Tax=Priestia megaterium TaxID=1404 RepID=UPI002D80947E|nr:hypothetical protein [Priestia megaterium]MEB4860616.1 hypothetical protein [Priestia megaterium]
MEEVSDTKVLARSTIEVIELSMKLDILIDTLAANGMLNKEALLEKFDNISFEERKSQFSKMFNATLEEILASLDDE